MHFNIILFFLFFLSFYAEKNLNFMLKPITCNICGEQVAGSRYAPHLERCMNGGKRGGRRYFDSLQDVRTVKVPKLKKDVDPYPESLIVRIKFKDGCKLFSL